MKQKLILLMMLACLALARAQNPINCIPMSQQQIAAPARPASMANCLTAIDDEVIKYIPNTSMPTLTYNVNFIFLMDQSQPTRYSNCTQAQLTKDADSMIAYCNRKFAACGSTPPSQGCINPSALVANPKIRLKRNNVYLPVSPLAFGAHFRSDSIYRLHPYDTSSTFNVYFYTETDTAFWSGGEATLGGEGYGYMTNPPFAPQYTPGIADSCYLVDNKDLFWHELCHGFGALADLYMRSLGANDTGPWFVETPNNSDPAIIGSNSNYPPVYVGYFPDDVAPDSARSYNCNIPTDTSNNNVMGNSFCRAHLSARQIASFHYLVAKGKTRKYTQYNGIAYPYTPSYTTTTALTLSGTQTLYSGSIPYFSTLTIAAGASITINNANIRIPYNGKIVVKPGGKLTLNCVKLSLAPNQQPFKTWYGIEVWGGATLSQSLTPSGMPVSQGMLVLNNCWISDAKMAVLAGKRYNNNNFSLAPGTGGGIIMANNSTFINNEQAIHMLPRLSIPPVYYSDNLTTFDGCQFTKTRQFLINNGGLINAMVDLEGVDKIKFYGNIFYPEISAIDLDTTICIRGINASIIMNDSQGANELDSTFYGIYLMGGKNSVIEKTNIYTRNGIYVSNSPYNKVVNNAIRLDYMPDGVYGSALRTGIYLNECTNFKIEGNSIAKTANNSVVAEGICVNNSGPMATQLYNNTFYKLTQGIWCQNQNYDPASPTYDGLKINCNDFNLCTYNIGVQTPLIRDGWWIPANYIETNWQSNFSQQCFNGGISQTQGIPSILTPTLNVRNTYSNVQGNSNENKFYSFTPYSNPPLVTHGNFKDAVTSPQVYKFRVGPQPLFSDSIDVTDIIGISAPGTKPVYCPDQSALPRGTNPASLTPVITGYNVNINSMTAQYNSKLDRGYTHTLLNYVNSSLLTTAALKDTLMSVPFLSDTVLTSYFTPTTVPVAYLQAVFLNNAPVSRSVWSAVQTRSLSGTVMATLTAKQFGPTLSPRTDLLAQLSIAKNERSYAIMHKSMAFISDSSATHVKDSVAALIVLNNMGDVQRQLIELDFSFSDYSAASSKLSTYSLADTAQRHKYVNFKNLLVTIMRDSLQLRSLTTHSAYKASVATAANDYNHPCMQEARNMLFSVFNSFYPEQKLVPQVEDRSGSRTMSSPVQAAGTDKEPASLAAGLSLYPNPASNELYIANSTGREYSYAIVNVSGQGLLQGQVRANGLNKVETGSLINGIYFVNLYDGKHLVKTSKLVIVK